VADLVLVTGHDLRDLDDETPLLVAALAEPQLFLDFDPGAPGRHADILATALTAV